MVDLFNNFWLADDARAFSSARQLITDDTDADYVAWVGLGNLPSTWPRDDAGNQTNASMQAVVGPLGMFVDLIYYAADARFRRASGGVLVTSLAPVPFLTDVVSRNTINSTQNYLALNGAGTVQWKMSDGSFITMTGAQTTTLMNSVAGFVAACFECESITVSGINGGTITTRQQVDDAFGAIANVYP